jgi:hypothetical protein
MKWPFASAFPSTETRNKASSRLVNKEINSKWVNIRVGCINFGWETKRTRRMEHPELDPVENFSESRIFFVVYCRSSTLG